MNIDAPHPEYLKNQSKWSRCRDTIEGEDAVKAGTVAYLPRLGEQAADEYNAYKTRASFFNATSRTLDSFVGMVFAQDPEVECPSSLAPFLADATLAGESFYDYQKHVLREVVSVGRGGTLVEMSDEEQRPFAVFYRAEEILNWDTVRVGGRTVLSKVVLKEVCQSHEVVQHSPVDAQGGVAQVDHSSVTGPAKQTQNAGEPQKELQRIRVLKLVLNPDGDGGQYEVETWVKVDERTGFQLNDTVVPTRRKKPLPLIPFVFHGPNNSKPAVDKPPLVDIADVNLSHYRTSADLEHGRHWTGLPTPVITGIEKQPITFGSHTVITSSNPDTKAFFMEFQGAGLTALDKAIEQKEHQMAVLGARMLDTPKRAAEAADTMRMKQTGEQASLSQVAYSLSESLKQVLVWALFWWSAADTKLEDAAKAVEVELNADFAPASMDAATITALVNACLQGKLSTESLLTAFKRAEIIGGAKTVEDELADIEAEGPPPPQGDPLPLPTKKKGKKAAPETTEE